MKEVWPQDGRAEVAKEEATRDQFVSHVSLANLNQVLADLVEASLQPDRKKGMGVGYPLPDDGDNISEVLPVGVEHLIVWHLDGVHFKVQI